MRRREYLLLTAVYLAGLYLRLAPRLELDPHLLTFQGDIWYRLCMAQSFQDSWRLPEPDIRYLAYGWVPMWYPPLSPVLFAVTSTLSGLDIPTVSSRIVPFIEAATPLTLYPLASYLYNRKVATVAVVTLALTPSFVFWSGISDPQSFTLFLIPLLVLVWVRHSMAPLGNLGLFLLGTILAFNFLLHLTYFLVVLTLLMMSLALVLNGARRSLLLDWVKVVLVSQVLTSPWWFFWKISSMPETFSFFQKNLYWWWIKALVTSSGLYTVERQLEYYGYVPAVLGILAFFYLAYGRAVGGHRTHLILVLWAIPLILEAENEAVLKALGKTALTWQTLYKPLEGFRFYCFLAQPLSIGIGVMIYRGMKVLDRFRQSGVVLPVLLMCALLFNLQQYDLGTSFQTSGLVPGEYRAALWYRENSGPEDRIIADYYRAQMFAGVCGGRALLGGMFPLRNMDYPYIKAPGQVQNDLFILYNTSDPETAVKIAQRYGATHIFYSRNMDSCGNLLSYYKPASEYGVDVNKSKFEDPRYFETVYRDGDIEIIKVLPPP